MQPSHVHAPVADDLLPGLAVYSSDFVPLGRIVAVSNADSTNSVDLADTLMGRRIAIDPDEPVRSTLDGDDLVVSEAMIFDVSPDQDRVILNVPARRVVAVASQLDRPR